MSTLIENAQSALPFDAQLELMLDQVVLRALEAEGRGGDRVAVSVLIADDQALHALNRDFRGVDSATDVLSFPALAFLGEDADGRPKADADSLAGLTDPKTGELMLGDIAISLERAALQAREYGHSLRRELAFLTVHGALHLLGYDHETPEEHERMTRKAQAVLDSLGIAREMEPWA